MGILTDWTEHSLRNLNEILKDAEDIKGNLEDNKPELDGVFQKKMPGSEFKENRKSQIESINFLLNKLDRVF